MMLSCMVATSRAVDEEHFLDYSEDNYKVAFMSDNLTAAVTHVWPRVVFYHSTDPFSPTFEVGLPRLYLYNDTNLDHEFEMSEVEYVSYMDENHVEWNVTAVDFTNDTVAGEQAHFRMNATLDLYLGMDNQTVAMPEWANITFWFQISEKNYTLSNALGSYVIKAKTDLSFNYTLNVLKSVNQTEISFEQLLQGGGVAEMFTLKQKGSHAPVVDRMVSSRVDETVYGSNFTNDFMTTSLPRQEICYAKEDGTVKAYYRWDSLPMILSGGEILHTPVNSSFLTTGTGMLLHSSYPITNETETIHQEASLGIDESAFMDKITDWMKENALAITLFVGSIAALIAAAVLVARWRKRPKVKETEGSQDGKKGSGAS